MLHVSIKKFNSRIEVAEFSLLQKHKTLKPLMDCKSETTSKVSLTFTSRINLGRRGVCAEPSTLDTAHRQHLPEIIIHILYSLRQLSHPTHSGKTSIAKPPKKNKQVQQAAKTLGEVESLQDDIGTSGKD